MVTFPNILDAFSFEDPAPEPTLPPAAAPSFSCRSVVPFAAVAADGVDVTDAAAAARVVVVAPGGVDTGAAATLEDRIVPVPGTTSIESGSKNQH